jgi:hypothetical protein
MNTAADGLLALHPVQTNSRNINIRIRLVHFSLKKVEPSGHAFRQLLAFWNTLIWRFFITAVNRRVKWMCLIPVFVGRTPDKEAEFIE